MAVHKLCGKDPNVIVTNDTLNISWGDERAYADYFNLRL